MFQTTTLSACCFLESLVKVDYYSIDYSLARESRELRRGIKGRFEAKRVVGVGSIHGEAKKGDKRRG